MELLLLEELIEALRIEMIEVAFSQGSFTHEKVVVISQQLDGHIVDYQVLKNRWKSANLYLYE